MKTIFPIIPACCFVFLLLASNSQAQNNLTAGSIGFVSYQSDKDLSNRDNIGFTTFTDRFAIVILNQTGLAANTVIYFTDNGWNASTGNFISGLSEGFIKWTVPAGGYPFGTQIYFISQYNDPVTSWGAYADERGNIAAGIVTTESGNNYMELSTGGDQVLAYQTGPARGPATTFNDINRRFLAGFNMYNANWDGNNPAGGHQSSVPPGRIGQPDAGHLPAQRSIQRTNLYLQISKITTTMRRRDFLYNTGLLIPALLAAPARLLASQKTIKTDLLIIQPATGAFNLPIQAQQLKGDQISQLEYSREGFLVTTSDNTLIQVPKIIIHASMLSKVLPSSLAINTGQQSFQLNWAAAKAQHTIIPEVWCLQTQQFTDRKTILTRKKHALICLSEL